MILTDDIGIGCLSEARGESSDGFITDRYFNSFDTLGSQMFEQMFGAEIVLQHNSQRSSPKYLFQECSAKFVSELK